VGELAAALGAGRARKGDAVDPAVGLDLAVEVGDAVEAGQPLATVHARDRGAAECVAAELAALVRIGDGPGGAVPDLLDVVR
jgi:thymidine phosphorylase